MRRRAAWLPFVLLFACQTLPSAVPLADTGGSMAAVPRPAQSLRADMSDVGAAGAGAIQEVVVTADAPKAVDTAADAGTPAALPSASVPETTAKWSGEYVGSDRLVRKFEDGPDDVQLDDKARTRVEQPTPSSLVISIINSATGDVICPLRASVSGNRATLETGQTCFGEDDSGARISEGHATLEGDRLVLEFEGSIEETDENPGERDSYRFDGTRR
jgi:hypothetical protein